MSRTMNHRTPLRSGDHQTFQLQRSPRFFQNIPPYGFSQSPTNACRPNFFPSPPIQHGYLSLNNLHEMGCLQTPFNSNSSYVESNNVASAYVDANGYITFTLPFGMIVFIGQNQSVLLKNQHHQTSLYVSDFGNQVYVIHPQGRVMQQNQRIEVQTIQDELLKTAKIWPRGISFTSNFSSLVYLVDPAGTRSTSDTFHNLYSKDIAQDAFDKTLKKSKQMLISACVKELESAQYKQLNNGTSCWTVSGITIKQTIDGMVSIEITSGDNSCFLRSSPNTGKVLVQSDFLHLTASVGCQAHLYVRSLERRIHVNTDTFVIRNAGQSAGLDTNGKLRIY